MSINITHAIASKIKQSRYLKITFTLLFLLAGKVVLSNSIALKADTVPTPSITITASSDSICYPMSVTFQASTVNAGPNPIFQWKKNGTNIPGATINYYYAKTSGTYKVQESNMCGSTITAGVTLTTKQCLMSNSSTNDGTIVSKIPQLKIAPNPFSNTTTISFSLTQSQKVSIQIFDATGRLIKTLTDAQTPVGAHQLVWNARDEKGNAVSTGIYFLRMQAGNYTETKKVVVAK